MSPLVHKNWNMHYKAIYLHIQKVNFLRLKPYISTYFNLLKTFIKLENRKIKLYHQNQQVWKELFFKA